MKPKTAANPRVAVELDDVELAELRIAAKSCGLTLEEYLTRRAEEALDRRFRVDGDERPVH